jgi:hypothetical protein
MKSLIFIGMLLLIGISSCTEEENEYLSNGTITGFDARMCVCCGGYFIDINDSTYRFYELPESSDVDLINAIFPIYVKLDWTKADNVCLGDEIKVIRIKLQ